MMLTTWRITLLLCASLLGGRITIVALRSEGMASSACLVAAGLTAAILCRPTHTLAAFVAAVPILSGLGRTGLIKSPEPLLLVFSGILIGLTYRSVTNWKAEPRLAVTPEPSGVVHRLMLLYGLATTVTLSWMVTASAEHMGSEFRSLVFADSFSAFGSPWYYWTSTFVWLSGLLLAGELVVSGGIAAEWRCAIVVSYVFSIVGFTVLQFATNLPEAFLFAERKRALTSPYEDIHSLGAISVSVGLGLLASTSYRTTQAGFLGIGGSGLMASIVIGSWSRATWLAGILGLGLIAWVRLGRLWLYALLAIGCVLLVYGNRAAQSETWQSNEYLWRLGSLIRFENPGAKDPSRVALYRKAFAMIRARPLTGHGIGSFYLTAPHYAAPADPLGSTPNFAHNFFLQFAAELGVPAALLLLTTIGISLYRSVSLYRQNTGDRLVIAGITCALICYLLTQVTANAVNIYPSNQFFFWPLVAALLAWPKTSVRTKP